jgi:hypothetical protein
MAAVPADLLDYLNTHMPRRSGGINATSTWKTRSFALSWTAHTAEEHTGLAYATTVLYPALGAAASQGRVDLAKVFRMKAAQ